MNAFAVQESYRFKIMMEEAIVWLYYNNLEQSEEFAEKKALELQNEVDNLKGHLKKTPQLGQADEISGLRRFPLYKGRYAATWLTDEVKKEVTLLEFIDLKYPQKLREVSMTHESDDN